MLRVLVGVVLCLATAPAAWAGAPAPIPHPVERALRVPVVVVGKVTGFEKETVDALPYPGAPNKVPYRIAVVKVETNLVGATNLTHLKVGFVPPPPPHSARRPARPDAFLPTLTEGQDVLLFLARHPDGAFYTYRYSTPPVDTKVANYKQQLEAVKEALAVIADPLKALKADSTKARFHAALVLVTWYRSPPEGMREVEAVPIAAEENRLILRSLVAGEWRFEPGGIRLSAVTAPYQLGLGEADGWKPPPARPGEDYGETARKAFAAWLAGPGKDFRIRKFVAKRP